MGQCVCGQYYNQGDVQCRFCGRLLQDSAYPMGQAGYDQYPAYPKPAEYDAGYAQKPFMPEAKPQQQPPQGYEAKQQQQPLPQGYDMQQRPYAQGQPAPSPVQQPTAAQPPRPIEPTKPAPKPAPGAARDVAIPPDVIAAIRTLKGRSLVQLIVIISGFAVSIGTSVYLIIVLSAILKALSQ